MTRVELGPADGTLLLHTTRAGVAGRIGHDLTIEVGQWGITFELDGDTSTDISMTAEVDSLSVVEGRGGLKPLSDSDKASIVGNAAKTLQCNKFPQIVFAAAGPSTRTIEGLLTIAGTAKPSTVNVVVDGRMVTATATVTQTEHGIKPYSAMLGQLRVADVVTISLTVLVPA